MAKISVSSFFVILLILRFQDVNSQISWAFLKLGLWSLTQWGNSQAMQDPNDKFFALLAGSEDFRNKVDSSYPRSAIEYLLSIIKNIHNNYQLMIDYFGNGPNSNKRSVETRLKLARDSMNTINNLALVNHIYPNKLSVLARHLKVICSSYLDKCTI